MCGSMTLSSFFFFFSSRRRHTRFDCDWSSDVCSSDLRHVAARQPAVRGERAQALREQPAAVKLAVTVVAPRREAVQVAQRARIRRRSEEHTSELQSQSNLVCRLLLEKKKKTNLTMIEV